jgi:hypothetical protein
MWKLVPSPWKDIFIHLCTMCHAWNKIFCLPTYPPSKIRVGKGQTNNINNLSLRFDYFALNFEVRTVPEVFYFTKWWTNAKRTVNERFVNGEQMLKERWTNSLWTVNERWMEYERNVNGKWSIHLECFRFLSYIIYFIMR